MVPSLASFNRKGASRGKAQSAATPATTNLPSLQSNIWVTLPPAPAAGVDDDASRAALDVLARVVVSSPLSGVLMLGLDRWTAGLVDGLVNSWPTAGRTCARKGIVAQRSQASRSDPLL